MFSESFSLSFEEYFRDLKNKNINKKNLIKSQALPRPIKCEWRLGTEGRIGNYTVEAGWKFLSIPATNM